MTAASPVSAAPKVETPLKRFVVGFLDSRVAMLGLVLLALVVFSALLAPWIAPQDPYDLSKLDIMSGMLPPGSADMDGNVFWLGSDEQGRDLLSAILYGLRTSLLVGFSSTAIALAIGLVIGMVAAYAGGGTDATIMRLVDIQLSFPAILIALILLAVLGKGVDKVIVALAAVQWAYYARTVRSAALVERRKEYVEAAQCLALPKGRIVLRHLLPNCLPPLIVVATVQVAHAITLEATLSFLGVGVPVTEPSLGMLIASGFDYMLSGEFWVSVFPGLALLITIVSINLVGDQMRDVLNPRLQH
ncbi:ABC transporter permease [Microvirga subterranea]|uniref:Peptide/nickel transport system permease protein n=1 Tax=Microvirga subterranea TaxID=186651 RepID=A0A370HDG8_9HYPH|nr:ABC transporter permease [Microvirga subterranea]RDI54893.1 peptide/nickel transport system permease protein [Microvirga subterranea]